MGERRAQEGFGEWSRVSQAKLTLRTPALIPDLGSRFISCLKRTKRQLQGAWSRFSWMINQSIVLMNTLLSPSNTSASFSCGRYWSFVRLQLRM
eukprot:scaffold78554_cov45-Attheya_sp.AAC.2